MRLQDHKGRDFRAWVVAHVAFLHREAVGVLGYADAYSHTIWDEVWIFTRYKEVIPASKPHTVVPQYVVYDCFERLSFRDQLNSVDLSREARRVRAGVMRQRHFDSPGLFNTSTRRESGTSRA